MAAVLPSMTTKAYSGKNGAAKGPLCTLQDSFALEVCQCMPLWHYCSCTWLFWLVSATLSIAQVLDIC